MLRQLPAEFVLRAERLYGVSRHWLRPDIYPVDLPPAPSRFVGVDRRASRGVALDRLANGVALDRMSGTKEASL